MLQVTVLNDNKLAKESQPLNTPIQGKIILDGPCVYAVGKWCMSNCELLLYTIIIHNINVCPPVNCFVPCILVSPKLDLSPGNANLLMIKHSLLCLFLDHLQSL